MLYRLNLSKYFFNSVTFLFVFSLFNDNFLVELLGANSLKAIFIFFLLVQIFRIYKNLMHREILNELIPFAIFYVLSYFMMLLNPPFRSFDGIFNNVLIMTSMFVLTTFFINADMRRIFYYIWISMVFSSILCYLHGPLTEWTFRKTGGTGDPNEFASQLLLFLYFSVFLFMENKNILFAAITIGAFTYGVLHAASLSSFIVLGLTLVFVLLRYMKLSFARSMLVMLVGFLVVGLLSIPLYNKIEKAEITSNILGRTENTGTADSRMMSWAAGVNMILANPLTGVGMNAYGVFSPSYSKVHLKEDSVAPHNVYIKILAESGVFVFLAFMYMLTRLLIKYFRRVMSSDYFWIYIGYVSQLLMGITLGLTYNKYFWLTIAIMMNMHIRIYREKKINSINQVTEGVAV